MKITIFGSCRQDSIYRHFDVSHIQVRLSFPHYTKEIIQAIQYCKGNFQHDHLMTQYCFRTGILEKKPIECQQELIQHFQSSDVVVIEIASRKSYEWNGMYVHHILTEANYGFNDIENIVIRDLSDEEIEADLLKIQDLVFPKKLVVVSHIYTRTIGKRYELVQLLERLTSKYQIPFINPSFELASHKSEDIYQNEPVLSHYTELGHALMGDIYKKYILANDTGSLRIYRSETPKIRIGSTGDGGYVVSDLSGYDVLISCGISNNIDFEEDFLNRYPEIPCYAFDGTIQELPHSNESIQFYKKNIGVENTETTTNLHGLISRYKNIFIKMDIETFEFRWLHTLSLDHLKRIKQMVIDFHFPTSIHPYANLDIQIPVPEKMAVFQKLASTHWLVHLHGNNVCDTMVYNDIHIPNVFKCTYIRKDQQSFCGYNTDIIPSPLDVPNVEHNPDIVISYPPFVHNMRRSIVIVCKKSYNNFIQTNDSGFWGIGDIIRGIYGIYNISKIYNSDVYVDMKMHALGKYLEPIPYPSEHIIHQLNKQNRISFIFKENIHTHIQNEFSKNNIIYFFSNMTPCDYNGIPSEDLKNFIKQILTPNKNLRETIDAKRKEIPYESYNILHYRLGDSILVRGEKDINYDNLYNHFLENYEPNDILITDSNDFRNYVRSHHSSAFVFDHDVCHIGYHHDTEHMPGICNTLVEFFLCTEASKLKTFSIYGWVSGFIYPIHKIYDIPLQSHVNLII